MANDSNGELLWARWRELCEFREYRPLEPDEAEEYGRIAAKLDAAHAAMANRCLDDLVAQHMRVIESIESLTKAVKAAAAEHGVNG